MSVLLLLLSPVMMLSSYGQEKWVEGPAEHFLCPDGNHPHAIDLGLPSGTLWACCNVGAELPIDLGNYYAWGEINPASIGDIYDWSTYEWGHSMSNMTKYNTKNKCGSVDRKKELEPCDDAATANWGAGWRTPSKDQFKELLKYCTCEWWTAGKYVSGIWLTSKRNGAMVFFMAGGVFGQFKRPQGILIDGAYWSRTLDNDQPFAAHGMYFSADAGYGISLGPKCGDVGSGLRCHGQLVRPVRVP